MLLSLSSLYLFCNSYNDKRRFHIRLPIKVIPASSRNRIVGWLGGKLKICVQAPAERGKANASVEKLVADALNIPVKTARIVTGKSSSQKIMEITGITKEETMDRLNSLDL